MTLSRPATAFQRSALPGSMSSHSRSRSVPASSPVQGAPDWSRTSALTPGAQSGDGARKRVASATGRRGKRLGLVAPAAVVPRKKRERHPERAGDVLQQATQGMVQIGSPTPAADESDSRTDSDRAETSKRGSEPMGTDDI